MTLNLVEVVVGSNVEVNNIEKYDDEISKFQNVAMIKDEDH
jgi:hypothetical protein